MNQAEKQMAGNVGEAIRISDTAMGPDARMTLSIDAALAQDFSGLPQVACVLTQQEGRILKVWLGLDDPSDDVRHRVFDKELAAIDAFPSVEFDFNLIPLMGRPFQDVISEPVSVAFNRR